MRAFLLCCVAVFTAGCFLDPTCKDTCDGDRIVSCKWRCSGQGKIDIPECERTYGGTNCAERTGFSGSPMSCRMAMTQASNAAPSFSPACVDLSSPCDRDTRAICTGDHSAASCVQLGDGGFLQPQLEPVCELPANQACHDQPFGIMCVPLPKRFCDPALFPSCNPDGGYDTCQGTPDAGSVIVPGKCSARFCTDDAGTRECGAMECVGDAGAAVCR